jgi:hypothetical protein
LKAVAVTVPTAREPSACSLNGKIAVVEREAGVAEREGLSPKLVKSHLFQALVMEDPG